MQAGDRETQNQCLVKAQRILGELLSSLKAESGGAMAENLNRLYVYMLEELVQANLYDKPEPIASVLAILRDLREAWSEVERVTAQASTGGV